MLTNKEMRRKLFQILLNLYSGFSVLMVVGLIQCNKNDTIEVFYKEDELLISAYLEAHADKYSTLLEVLDITGIKPITVIQKSIEENILDEKMDTEIAEDDVELNIKFNL